MKLLVVGAGAAGVAAAFQARLSGADVRLLHDRPGATELYTGVVDVGLWTQANAEASGPALERFIGALDLWEVSRGALVATNSGVVRPCAGADRAILNLAPFAGRCVGVPKVERDEWDAALLVRALSDSAWTRTTGTRFEVIDVPLLQHGYERRIAAHDFAALHDVAERRHFFCQRLGNAGSPDAWLSGPWLGTLPETARHIATQLATPIGETTSLPGGAAGARYAVARDRLLRASDVEVRRARVVGVERQGQRWLVNLGDAETLHADGVVLALGGLISGGLELADSIVQATHTCFRLSVAAPVELQMLQRPIDSVSSVHGLDFAAHGMGVLEKVGAKPAAGSDGLRLAGDVTASVKTTLMAVLQGLAAADELCR